MRLSGCLTILHMSVLATLAVRLEADGEKNYPIISGEDCYIVIGVRRNTVYEVLVGEDLTINCTVDFCNNSPPTVSWFKPGETDVPVNVSSSSHIKTYWKNIDNSRGVSFLVFEKILLNDSGQYQCQSEGSFGHNINVSVYDLIYDDDYEDVVDYSGVLEPHEENRPFLHIAFRVVGIVVLVIMVMIIYVASRSGCKVKDVYRARTSRETPDLSPHHIYENDPTTP